MRTINRKEILAGLGHIVVLKGGKSAEREISLISGGAVFDGLQRLGIKSSAIDVGNDVIARLIEARPDLVFNMLHGQGGEDGVIQGLLETMGIPYTGSGVLASALAMDKIKSKLIWQRLGLSTAEFLTLDVKTDWQAVIDQLGKVVVKPVNGGSSLGISIVDNAEDLAKEFQVALQFDTQVMAEKCIEGREFSTGVLEDQLFPTIQLETNREFFDFEAKYKDENTRMICPPELDDDKYAELEQLVRRSYESLDCSGLARVDVMQNHDGEFFLLELNTVPGMTGHSFVPMAAQKVGIDFDELLLRILEVEAKQGKQ
ncbi:MAG: D-alanine--D-alanine ligase [Proteobacteria bacterium]|nr:D-alanine--D-alanine ligase [Pseudomonadota bacterium]